MSRKIKWALTLSVILNIALIGLIAGFSYKRLQGVSSFDKSVLSDPGRSVLKDAIAERRSAMMGHYQDARAARRALVEILSADEFDEEAFDQAAARSLSITGDVAAAHIDGIRALALALPAEDRKALARHLVRKLGPGYHRKGRGSGEKHESVPRGPSD